MIMRSFKLGLSTLAVILFFSLPLSASAWENWEPGGELGLALGAGSDEGRILSPGVALTLTKVDINPVMELGLAYYFGSEIGENYTEEDAYGYDLGDQTAPGVIADAGEEVRRRLSVVPFTLNFIYTIYDDFYIGGGVGLYNVWFRKEPLGDWRAYPDPDVEKGEIYSHSPTTTFGFQQVAGMEIFPMSDNWSWFIGIRSFLTSGTAAGRILGITVGGKVRYSW